MKTLSFLFLALLLSSSIFSQGKVGYEVSAPYEYIETASAELAMKSDYSFTNADKSKTLLIKHYNNFYMQVFDNKTLKELKHNKYKLVDEIGYSAISDIVWLGDKLYCIYFRFEDKKWVFMYREIDFNLGRFSGKETVFFSIDAMKSPAAGWNFPCRVTSDQSKLVIFYRQYPKNVKDGLNYDDFSFFMFDKSFKEIAKHEIKMPYTEKKMDNIQYLMDEEANVFILTKVFNDDSRKDVVDKVVNYHYEIFKVNIQSASLENIKIPVDQLITDIALAKGNNGILFCAGYYTKRYTKNLENFSILNIPLDQASVDGMFVFKIDKNNEIVEKKNHEIPEDIINLYGTKNKSELVNLKFRHLISQADNSIILIGEQITSSYSGIQFADNIVIRLDDAKVKYNDILMTKMSADGTVLWMKRLPKKQFGTQYGYNICADLSFGYQFLKGAHYLVIIDNVKNMNLGLNQVPAEHQSTNGGYLTLYKVEDATGAITKSSVFNTEELEPGNGVKNRYGLSLYNISKLINTSDSSFMLEFYKKFQEDVLIQIKVE